MCYLRAPNIGARLACCRPPSIRSPSPATHRIEKHETVPLYQLREIHGHEHGQHHYPHQPPLQYTTHGTSRVRHHPIVLFCVASLAPTAAGVAVAAQASFSITTLTSNGSPPTSPSRLPAGELSRGGDVGLGLLAHRLRTQYCAAWVGVGGWIAPGPAVVLRGPKGGYHRRCRSEELFLAGGLARCAWDGTHHADVTLHKCGYLFSRAHVVGLG